MKSYLPFIIGLTVSIVLGSTVWWGFYPVFTWIGASISAGIIVERKITKIDFGRKLALLLILPVFFIYFGILQRENMQIEETVFYFLYFLTAGVFTRVLIHFAIAKIFGPLIWGRGFCGWACWTASILECLPIKENKQIPTKYTYFRIIVLIISLLIPILFIAYGYDYYNKHIYGVNNIIIQKLKFDQLVWFLAGNGIYYVLGIILAFKFRKKRAFCKIMCPVSLVMKAQTKISIIRKKPSGNNCIGCGKCNKHCPMDVNIMNYIINGKDIRSSECILCGICSKVCPQKAII